MKISEGFRKQLRKRPKRGDTDSMIIHDLLDDVGALAARLWWSNKMLVRAKSFVCSDANEQAHNGYKIDDHEKWLDDLNRGPEGKTK